MTAQHTTPPRLTVITASVREGRAGPMVADWITALARAHGGFTVTTADLADYPLPLALPAVSPAFEPDPERPAGMTELTGRLREADAFVVVTPDYNRSFPASVKAAIDWHYTEWQHKAIGFVGLGAPPGRSPGRSQRRPARHRAAAAGLQRAAGPHRPRLPRLSPLLPVVRRERRAAGAEGTRGRRAGDAGPAPLVGVGPARRPPRPAPPGGLTAGPGRWRRGQRAATGRCGAGPAPAAGSFFRQTV